MEIETKDTTRIIEVPIFRFPKKNSVVSDVPEPIKEPEKKPAKKETPKNVTSTQIADIINKIKQQV